MESLGVSTLLKPLLLKPPGMPLLLMAVGFLIARKKPRIGYRLVAAAAVLLYLLSTEAVGFLLLRSHGSATPPPRQQLTDVQAIVVLGAGVAVNVSGTHLSGASAGRATTALKLFRELQVPVLTSGAGTSHQSDAHLMASYLLSQGVPPEQLLLEEHSRSTLQNAENSAKLLKEKKLTRIALVTEPTHLARAVRCFRAEGLTVIPYPSPRYLPGRWSQGLAALVPTTNGQELSGHALEAWVARAWYLVRYG